MRYTVMVPVISPGTGDYRRFRVEMQYDGEITKAVAANMRKQAAEYVQGRQIEIRMGETIEIYRKGK